LGIRKLVPHQQHITIGGLMDDKKVSTLVRWINKAKKKHEHHISEYQLFDMAYAYFFKAHNPKMVDAHIQRFLTKGIVPPFVEKYCLLYIYPTFIVR